MSSWFHAALLKTRGALAAAACLATFGCSGDPEAGFRVEQSAIVNGEASGTNDDEVVFLIASKINETRLSRMQRNAARTGRAPDRAPLRHVPDESERAVHVQHRRNALSVRAGSRGPRYAHRSERRFGAHRRYGGRRGRRAASVFSVRARRNAAPATSQSSCSIASSATDIAPIRFGRGAALGEDDGRDRLRRHPRSNRNRQAASRRQSARGRRIWR